MSDAPFLKQVIAFLLMGMASLAVEARCQGKWVNPITDICWSCIFPLTLGGVKMVKGSEDTPNPRQLVCSCLRPPLPGPVPGIPVSFWEPTRLVDVTRTPYCLVNMGGIQMINSHSTQGVGSASTLGGGSDRSLKHSFYQVHWYLYPVVYWLNLLIDFSCLEQGDVDLVYLTELDPLWNDDESAFILNPEAVLFGNPVAQAACAADCVAATTHFPMDSLFWCGGCQGSLYPFSGNVSAHVGGVQASLLLTQRMIAKLHREFLLQGTSGFKALCGKYPMPIIRKSQYKTQMVYPIPYTQGCQPLGRSDVIWGSGREFPYQGEDFGYLIFRKRNCCML